MGCVVVVVVVAGGVSVVCCVVVVVLGGWVVVCSVVVAVAGVFSSTVVWVQAANVARAAPARQGMMNFFIRVIIFDCCSSI